MKAVLYEIPVDALGRLAIVPRPRGGDWLEDEVRAWREAGITTVVSMLTSEETRELGLEQERSCCEFESIMFVNIPITDRGVPSEAKPIVRAVDEWVAHIANGKFVGVHCRASIGRAGMFAASALVRMGADAEEAFAIVERVRGCAVPDTEEQRRWVMENVKPAAR